MRKPKFIYDYCGESGESCPYDVDGLCHAYGGYRDQDVESGHKMRLQSCVNEHGRGKALLWKNIKSISQLKRGDTVRSKSGGKTYMVTCVYGDRATAVRTADITNPVEWQVLRSEETK